MNVYACNLTSEHSIKTDDLLTFVVLHMWFFYLDSEEKKYFENVFSLNVFCSVHNCYTYTHIELNEIVISYDLLLKHVLY